MSMQIDTKEKKSSSGYLGFKNKKKNFLAKNSDKLKMKSRKRASSLRISTQVTEISNTKGKENTKRKSFGDELFRQKSKKNEQKQFWDYRQIFFRD